MNVIIENEVNGESIKDLVEALERETFAEACCVGRLDNGVYLKCPHKQHGVIVDTNAMQEHVIEWAIDALRRSVSL